MPDNDDRQWMLWGASLSPYALKVDMLLRRAGVPFIWLPEQGTTRQALRYQRRIAAVKRGKLKLTYPPTDDLQEFPLVPYLFGPDGECLYDSTAIGEWLHQQNPTSKLLPDSNTAESFAVRLIDEALDEFGLYMVHHNRWVNAAADNNAGERLAGEMKPLLGPLSGLNSVVFPPRQVRRLPYLFSVDAGTTNYQHLPPRLRPPAREGFPPTHKLLDDAFVELLSALEPVYSRRTYLFGEQMTLADASIFGQLGMNKTDPSAWRIIEQQAPHTAAWISKHYRQNVAPNNGNSEITEDLAPLLNWCGKYFVPLMQQNYRAYEQHRSRGETLFNEKAFNKNRALYNGTLAGKPFRSVAKTFQVAVWNKLHAGWMVLPHIERQKINALMESSEQMDTPDGALDITI